MYNFNLVPAFIMLVVIGVIIGGFLFWGIDTLATHVRISVEWV